MILAIDQGTTGTTCLVFDEKLELRGRAYREFEQHFPHPGWVEHDTDEIWRVTQGVADEAVADAGIRFGDLGAVGITNQRETVCVWDPATGEPLHRAIVWQDRRTAERCAELKAAGAEDLVREKTGLVLDPYFSGTKIEWLLREVDGLRDRAEAGRAVFGTIDAWLAFRLCGEHVTEPTNASRTLLWNLEERRWDPELLDLLGVPEAALPRVGPSAGRLGETSAGVPLSGMAGDQQAALVGQACLERGLGKNTYGTGSFLLLHTGSERPPTAPGLLTTAAASPGGEPVYALEASMFVTGAAVQWLRDGLGIIDAAEETEGLAASLHSNDGVYFVPALAGLGSPHWDPYARGALLGLTRGTTRAHIARAALEGIAYQAVDSVRAMKAASGEALAELRADGGATANGWLMQFQADVLGVPVVVPEVAETTARGAAALAGIGAGLLDEDAVRASWRARETYEPKIGEDEREELLANWERAVERSRDWASR